jgi:hypothetical protein
MRSVLELIERSIINEIYLTITFHYEVKMKMSLLYNNLQ